MRNSMIFTAASALLIAMVSAASATAIFSVTATSTLEFELPSPDQIIVGHDFNKIAIGNDFAATSAGVTFSTALSPAGVLPVTETASATGSASSSIAGATLATSHNITLGRAVNVIMLPFKFTYSWDITVAVDDPTLENARGRALSVIAEQFGPEDCPVDGAFTDCTFEFIADTGLGQSGSTRVAPR